MNNMQKSFKTKSKLRCMADGGAIDPKTQLGILGGDKTVGPGAGLKGTDTIFKNTVGGVPTFTDQAARQPGATAYTQNAAQPMGNFATNQAGRTVTPSAPVSGVPAAGPSPMLGTANTMMNLAKGLPGVGPMVSVGQDVATKMSSGLPSVSPAAATAQAAVTAAGRSGIGDIIRRQNLPVAAAAAPPAAAPTGRPALVQDPYEKMTGQAAGSTSAAVSSRPSWATGPRDGSKPMNFGPVGTQAPPPVSSMPAPASLRPAPVPMDYYSSTNAPPRRGSEEVAQFADGGEINPDDFDLSTGKGRHEYAAALGSSGSQDALKKGVYGPLQGLRDLISAAKNTDNNYANMGGGKITGPGGPTDDKIPAVLNGKEEIRVSDGEYVLPADTVDAVGVDKLDALRAATHKFVGGPKARRGLRKYADGIYFGADDLNDELDRTAPAKGKELVPYNDKAMVPYTPPPVATTPLNPVQELMSRADKSIKGKVGAGGGLLTGVLEANSVANDWKDLDGGGQKTARVAEGVGRTAGSIAGGGLGAAAGSMIAPGLGTVVGGVVGGIGGYLAPDATNWAANKFFGTENQLASTSAAQNRDSRIAAHVQGQRDAADRASVPPEAAKLSLGQRAAQAEQAAPAMSAIQQSAMDSANSVLSRRDRGGFNARAPDNSRDINKHFDSLIQNISGKYSSKGQGNLAKHLVEIEKARAAALGMDNRTQADVVNQNISGNSALRGHQAQQRSHALGALSAIGNTQAMGASNSLLAQSRTDAAQIEAAQKAQAKALDLQLEGEKTLAAQEESGAGRYTKTVDSIFATEDGVDARARDRFNSFVAATNPEYLQEVAGVSSVKGLMALPPQEQMTAIQKLRKLAEMNEVRNATAESGSLWSPASAENITTGMDMPVEDRESQWNDYTQRNLPLKDYLWSNIPLTDTNVIVGQSGQPVLRSQMLRAKGGGRDGDKAKAVSDSVKAHQRLRGE